MCFPGDLVVKNLPANVSSIPRGRKWQMEIVLYIELFFYHLMPFLLATKMAAVPPDLTSVFHARRMVDDMEKTKHSFLARICLLEVRG